MSDIASEEMKVHFDTKDLTARQIYALLIGLVAPRPIALVTSMDAAGKLNAAPFSAFNYVGVDPPLVVIGVQDRPGTERVAKDTARNIRHQGEFVVNVVTEDVGDAMNVCAIDFPPGVSELEEAGLTTTPSRHVKVPRIAQCHAALECREVQTVEIGRTRLIIGEVLSFHVDDPYVDPKGPYIKAESLHHLGRMNGLGSYVRTRDAFVTIPRLELSAWNAGKPHVP